MIPMGEYIVTLFSDMGQLSLIGGGQTHKIPATRRRSAVKTKYPSVAIVPGGGVLFSLVVSTPKQGEWIAMLETVIVRERGSRH